MYSFSFDYIEVLITFLPLLSSLGKNVRKKEDLSRQG